MICPRVKASAHFSDKGLLDWYQGLPASIGFQRGFSFPAAEQCGVKPVSSDHD
jgi:hypothetical protein